LLHVALALSLALAGQSDAAALERFEKDIRPVLVEHCYRCHSVGAKKLQGGLLLDTRAGTLRGGDSGPALVPGKPGRSLLLSALRYEDLEMPPKGRLPDRVIADFERWVKEGAPDSRESPTAAEDVETGGDAGIEAARRLWAFRTPTRQDPPAASGGARPRGRVDAFVVAKLEESGLSPAPPASARALVRRVSFDLTGLPSSPEVAEAFAADPDVVAYERLVDDLLASPRFGERWARMWLDVSRYAEDQAHIVGNNQALFYPNAHLFRDWVIAALNADMPYDQFVRLQLAADLLGGHEGDRAALGFLGLGPKYYRRNDVSVMADEWEDRVDTVTRGLLGLTVACARCHDHKYDPIETEDYYALAGVFASTEMFNLPIEKPASSSGSSGKDGKKKRKKSSPGQTMHVIREGKPRDLEVFVRGDPTAKGPTVPRRFLRVLSAQEPEPFSSGSGRLGLAEAIVAPGNPLTARVIVNRVWALLFGRGLVGTPSNFGKLGEAPTHPRLLDDLAARFVENGWSVKQLIRELVLSATYRQSSQITPAGLSKDPTNRLLWRMPRRRLDVEAWRDSLLLAAGRLDAAVGGRSVSPQDPEERRRTLYSRVSRFELDKMLVLFDFPDANVHSAGRVHTTTPLQKLFAMNSAFLTRQADFLADRLLGEKTRRDARGRIGRAYRIVYGRPPSTRESDLGVAFLDGAGADIGRWRQYTQALLMSNEALFVD